MRDDKADARWRLDAGRLDQRPERGVGFTTSDTQACNISETRACGLALKSAIFKRTTRNVRWRLDAGRLDLRPERLFQHQRQK